MVSKGTGALPRAGGKDRMTSSDFIIAMVAVSAALFLVMSLKTVIG